MLGQIFFWLYSQSTQKALTVHERGVMAQYVFLLCTTEEEYQFQVSKIFPEVQRFIEKIVGCPDNDGQRLC